MKKIRFTALILLMIFCICGCAPAEEDDIVPNTSTPNIVQPSEQNETEKQQPQETPDEEKETPDVAPSADQDNAAAETDEKEKQKTSDTDKNKTPKSDKTKKGTSEKETNSETQDDEPTLSVLFIGNSFTYCNELPDMFYDICESAGKNVDTIGVTVGSAHLTWFLDPSKGVYKDLERELQYETFDYVFLQEQSSLPYKNYAEFKEGAKNVLAKIKKSSPKCKAYLYETWGYHDKASKQTSNTKSQEIQLFDAYKSLGEEMGLPVSYAGVTHYRVYKETNLNPYNEDLMHPSYIGTYAAAMTHFFTLFPDAATDDVTFNGTMSTQSAAKIRKFAYEVAHSNNPKSFIK